jgi:hypothetical protein
MNKERRDAISKIRASLENITAELEELKDQEQEAYDNMPEGLQAAALTAQLQTWIQQ